MSTTVPSHLALVIRASADRSVSTASVRMVHAMIPLIDAKEHDEVFLSRDTIAEHSGLHPSKVLPLHYPRQAAELGVIVMMQRGTGRRVQVDEDTWRGECTSWAYALDAYVPRDVPALELETEEYWGDLDFAATVAGALNPVSELWANDPEAYRLMLALTHHGGFKRIKVTPKLAAEILGKSRVTGWRALKTLEAKGLFSDGWFDLSPELRDASLVRDPDIDHQERVNRREARRWSWFTRQGRETLQAARQTQATYPQWKHLGVLETARKALEGTTLDLLCWLRKLPPEPVGPNPFAFI